MILILVPTICLVLILIMIVGILIFLRRIKKKETEPPKPVNHPPFAIWSYDGKMMYETIIDAVDDFDSKHEIGVGVVGLFIGPNYQRVNPLSLKSSTLKNPTSGWILKSFENEMKEFDWCKRANVIKGVADALSYLHHDCLEPIVHRDLSSSNVLLVCRTRVFVGSE
ncbi:putative protein kinase RLK-Pelle-LRR-XI-1 family [Helianthus anomalus]